MPGLDPAKAKQNTIDTKAAVKKAKEPGKGGGPNWVGIAFGVGKAPTDTIFMASPTKKGPALLKVVKAADQKAKSGLKLGVGRATVSGKTLWLALNKKVPGADKLLSKALTGMGLHYVAKYYDEPGDEKPPAAPPPEAEGDEDEDEDGEEGDQEASAGGDDETGGDEDEAEEGDETGEAAEGEDEDGGDTADEDGGAETDADADGQGEEAEDEEEAPQVAAKSAYKTGSVVWTKTHKEMAANLEKLKGAIRTEYKSEAPAIIQQIEGGFQKVDAVIQKLDLRLSDALDAAHEASQDPAALKAAKAKAKQILMEYITYVKSDATIGHLDSNPFGVDLKLKATIVPSLMALAKTVS